MPFEHSWPDGHALPQVPQLALSVFVFAQIGAPPPSPPASAPPHNVSPCWQLTAHAPFEHTWPDGHALPQVPQLARSVFVLTQVTPASPVQLVSPGAQTIVHALFAHATPGLH